MNEWIIITLAVLFVVLGSNLIWALHYFRLLKLLKKVQKDRDWYLDLCIKGGIIQPTTIKELLSKGYVQTIWNDVVYGGNKKNE